MQIDLLVKNDDAHRYLMDLSLHDGIERASVAIEGEGSRINLVSFVLPGNSIKAAKTLAKFRDDIDCEGIALINDGPSKRFEVALYSLIADFERGLRGILSIYRALNNADSNSVLDNPEQQDFGAIFTALFVDESFVVKARKIVNSGVKYEKDILVKRLLKETEHAYWDELFPQDAMPTIRQYHDEIRFLRNDVMHSHYMTPKRYTHARTLLTKAIDEMSDFVAKDIASNAMEGTERLSWRITQDQAKALAEVIARTLGPIEFNYDMPGITRALVQYNDMISDIGEKVAESWSSTYGPLVALLGAQTKINDLMRQTRIEAEANCNGKITEDVSDDTG